MNEIKSDSVTNRKKEKEKENKSTLNLTFFFGFVTDRHGVHHRRLRQGLIRQRRTVQLHADHRGRSRSFRGPQNSATNSLFTSKKKNLRNQKKIQSVKNIFLFKIILFINYYKIIKFIIIK